MSNPQSKIGKIINFPFVRIAVAILFLIPIIAISNAVSYLTDSINEPLHSITSIIRFIVTFALFLISYHFYTKIVEKRKALEMSKDNAFLEWLIGFLISFVLVGSMVLVMSISGFYKIESTNGMLLLIKNFAFFGLGAFTQTLLFRLIIFKNIEEFLGTWIAVIISAAFFGFAHIINENATFITSLSLMISEIMLVGSFILTRRVWLVWGIHMGWNFLQAGVFGMPNSGITFNGYIKPLINGPTWLTGGAFGIEASVISFLMNVIVGIAILYLAVKYKQTIKTKWNRE
jgi:membrane protease YdiL (CAAX protease family)